ncbi:MAG: ARMT1-like domain-containing protein [Bacteroidales bacterium]
MISDYRCFFCLVKSFEKLLEKESVSREAKNSFTLDMVSLYLDRHEKASSPEFARDLHRILKSYTKNPDPYRIEKRQSNIQALDLLPRMQNVVMQSSDPFITALRLALAGNVIDFAANQNFNLENTISKSLEAVFAIDHSEHLRRAVSNAESILYLGDNAGEIVFDKLFIQTINHKNIIYAVRGMPVINDATTEDAEFTGMSEVAEVISNGYDAPSTIVDKSSEEFRSYFNNAELIISKGQGNLEGLLHLNDKRIFFLLMVKCNVMADFLKTDKDSFVVYNSTILNSVTC